MAPHEAREALPPPPEKGYWLALLLDGKGGARDLDWDGIRRWTPEQGGLWLQLNPHHEGAMAWLREESGLSERERHELLHCDDRPSLRLVGERGVVVSLVRASPRIEELKDMQTVRTWVDPTRAISLIERAAPVTSQALNLLREGRGPHTVSALFAWHVATTVNQLTLQAGELEHAVADLEFAAHDEERYPEAIREGQARVALLLRHVSPLKVITNRALTSAPSWVTEETLDLWRFAAEKARNADQILRIVQERSLTLHAYVSENLTLRMNSILLVLTVVSTVTLPATLIAAFFNINIGIPGRSLFHLESSLAFALTVGGLLLIAGLMYVVLRRQRLFQPTSKAPE